MSLTVLDPGLYSLLVDAGRPRSRSLGVPLGGAADRDALALSNALLGNPWNYTALEITLRGPTLRAHHAVACVLFGAAFEMSVNSRAVPTGQTLTLEAGDVLRIGGTPTGARGYLAVAGGFQSRRILESDSALEPLKLDDTLRCGASRVGGRSLPFRSIPSGIASSPHASILRVLDGPQRDWFQDETFWNADYEVRPASNRMGLRLHGPSLSRRSGELVSEAVAPGAVQVANDGLPIVLGVDGQTIGGYPKIAHVIRADLNRLAQLRPGDRIRFHRVNEIEAELAAKEAAASLRLWLARLLVTAISTPHPG